jgi:hypothetical protein
LPPEGQRGADLPSRLPGASELTQFVAEILLLATAFPLYFLVRGFTRERVDLAFDNADDLIGMEKSLGIFWEADLQELILPHGWLVDTFNTVYLYGHLPMIPVIAVWLYFWHRPQYLLMRNAFLISGAMGLIVYAVYPVAPPRFLEELGFTDTVFSQYGVSRVANPAFLRNEYAAVPSLHFGWNVLIGVAVWLASRHVALRAFAVIMPFATLAAVVLTANHFILDAVAGLAVIAVGMALAAALRRFVLRFRSPVFVAQGEAGWRRWLCWLGGATADPGGGTPAGAGG